MKYTLASFEDEIFKCNNPVTLRKVSAILQTLSNMAYAEARQLETKDKHFQEMADHSAQILSDQLGDYDG